MIEGKDGRENRKYRGNKKINENDSLAIDNIGYLGGKEDIGKTIYILRIHNISKAGLRREFAFSKLSLGRCPEIYTSSKLKHEIFFLVK